MVDVTEDPRRAICQEVAGNAGDREHLESLHGQVWSTDELCKEFTVLGFLAPYVTVRSKSDNKLGSLMFQHSPRYYFPRYYFLWQEDS